MKIHVVRTALLISTLGVISFHHALGQASTVFTLPALTDVSKVRWRDSIYLFPEFRKGKITYNKGELDHSFDLNYNVYLEKVEFISASGDTLAITNTKEIRFIEVMDNLLFQDYPRGFYEIILKSPVALAVRHKFVLTNIEFSSGAKGHSSTGMEVRGVPTDYGRLYHRDFIYFFMDTEHKLHKANRSSILKLFRTRTSDIQTYLLANPVNFESRDDLIRLITFCNQYLPDNR